MFPLEIRSYHTAVAVILSALLAGCSYKINYPLTAETTPPTSQTSGLKVAVIPLDDTREDVERQKSARKTRGDEDFGDYTSDDDFGGSVAPSISELMAAHLTFAGAFQEVRYLDATRAATPAVLDSLNQQGVDAVLTGNLERFQGYYDQRPGTKALAEVGLALAFALPVAILTTSTETTPIQGPFGPIGETTEVETSPLAIGLAAVVGAAVGSLIESSSSRRIAWHTRLSLELLETTTGEVLWAGTTEVQDDVKKAMSGMKTNTRKQEVAVASLQTAVNGLVDQLSQADLQLAAKPGPGEIAP